MEEIDFARDKRFSHLYEKCANFDPLTSSELSIVNAAYPELVKRYNKHYGDNVRPKVKKKEKGQYDAHLLMIGIAYVKYVETGNERYKDVMDCIRDEMKEI